MNEYQIKFLEELPDDRVEEAIDVVERVVRDGNCGDRLTCCGCVIAGRGCVLTVGIFLRMANGRETTPHELLTALRDRKALRVRLV